MLQTWLYGFYFHRVNQVADSFSVTFRFSIVLHTKFSIYTNIHRYSACRPNDLYVTYCLDQLVKKNINKMILFKIILERAKNSTILHNLESSDWKLIKLPNGMLLTVPCVVILKSIKYKFSIFFGLCFFHASSVCWLTLTLTFDFVGAATWFILSPTERLRRA